MSEKSQNETGINNNLDELVCRHDPLFNNPVGSQYEQRVA